MVCPNLVKHPRESTACSLLPGLIFGKLSDKAHPCNSCLKEQKGKVPTPVRFTPTVQSLLPKTSRIPPSIGRKAVNFGTAVGRHASHGFKRSPPEVVAERLLICNRPCEKVSKGVCTHQDCGCPVEKKVAWLYEPCPLGKWPKADPPPSQKRPAASNQH